MSKICRTCFQKCTRSFTTNQNLGYFGGEAVKISYVLRFCIPELYLGLSSSPEICYNCKESLKVSYLFKKKCLSTEQIIGNYLKNTRSTGKSVDLHDVLAYTDVQQSIGKDLEKLEQPVSASSISTFSSTNSSETWDWKITPLKPPIVPDIEVRQSAPNPTNSKELILTPIFNPSEKLKNFKFCEETGLFVNQQEEKCDYLGNSSTFVNKNIKLVYQGQVLDNSDNSVTNVLSDPATSSEDLDNICKITSVFSLSQDEVNKSSEESVQPAVNESDEAKNDLEQIKTELLEIDVNEEGTELTYIPTDEETLDASETGSLPNLECNSNLQGIIDNIPEINDSNHYVDIPEFVQINNFGLKELEELRRQQQNQTVNAEKTDTLQLHNKIIPSNEVPASISLNQEAIIKKDEVVKKTDNNEKSVPLSVPSLTPVEQNHVHLNPHVKIVELGPEHFKKMHEVVYIDGRKYKKYQNQFRYVPESKDDSEVIVLKKTEVTSGADAKTGDAAVPNKPTAHTFSDMLNNKTVSTLSVAPSNPTVSASTTADIKDEQSTKRSKIVQLKPTVRQRKKIKIVPVGDNKYALLGSEIVKKSIHQVPIDSSSRSVLNDKDVVVLFTNFTMDGTYINDHDYLINPYKRNKVLIEEKDQWMCMCYICDKKHHTHEHVRHMSMHDPKCKICLVDLGTPYMLNVHVKTHCKPCRQCTQRVPYGQIESHEHSHYIDELEFEKEPKRKYAHLRARRRRAKRQLKPFVPIKPPPVKLEQSSADTSLDDLDDTPLSALVDLKFDEVARITEEPRIPKKRGRKRKTEIKVEDTLEESDEKNFRVLRSNVRKTYTESESEDDSQKNSEVVENMSSGAGPP